MNLIDMKTNLENKYSSLNSFSSAQISDNYKRFLIIWFSRKPADERLRDGELKKKPINTVIIPSAE